MVENKKSGASAPLFLLKKIKIFQSISAPFSCYKNEGRCSVIQKRKEGGGGMYPFLWFAVILASGATAFVITWPLAHKVTALERLVEMLADTIRRKFDKK